MVKNNDIERILLMGIGRSGLDNETSIIAKALSELMDYRAIGTVEELQSMKEKNDTLRALYEDARKEGNHLIAKERAAAIDEFAEAIRAIHYKYPIGTDADTNEPLYGHEDGTWHNLLDDVSVQMKAGE